MIYRFDKEVEVWKFNYNKEYTIQELKEILDRALEKGASHLQIDNVYDRTGTFEWFKFYYERTDEELKQLEIQKLEDEIKRLKNE